MTLEFEVNLSLIMAALAMVSTIVSKGDFWGDWFFWGDSHFTN